MTEITPDQIVLWRWGIVSINATIIYTWVVMALLVVSAWAVTRNLSIIGPVSRRQNLFEVLITVLQDQIREISHQDPSRYMPFLGSLFLFIAVSNVLSVVPGFHPPTGSLSTTAALALCVFIAVPFFGIAHLGWRRYLQHYIRPTIFMLPFHVIGELSRTLALAIRLFGNVMSGTKIVGILLALTPLFFPVVMQALELMIGLIQAYIFTVLSMVYIASASRAHEQKKGEIDKEDTSNENEGDEPYE